MLSVDLGLAPFASGIATISAVLYKDRRGWLLGARGQLTCLRDVISGVRADCDWSADRSCGRGSVDVQTVSMGNSLLKATIGRLFLRLDERPVVAVRTGRGEPSLYYEEKAALLTGSVCGK
jgi:hypothetical protein